MNLAIGLFGLGFGLGIGLIIVGGAWGIGVLARAALESTARQPEAANDIQTQMVIAAALIEGFTLVAIGVVGYAVFVLSGLA